MVAGEQERRVAESGDSPRTASRVTQMRSPAFSRIASAAPRLIPEIVFAIAMAFSFALSRTPLVTPDSGGYLRAGQTFVGSPNSGVTEQTTWGGISLTGDAFRAWPSALFYALVPPGDDPLGMWGRSALQALLICGLTIWLALELARLLPRPRGLLLRCAIYLFALAPSSLSYTFLIGAEAVTTIFVLAGIALCLAGTRWITASTSLGITTAICVSTWILFLLATLVRPSAVVLLIVGTCALVWKALSAWRQRAARRSLVAMACVTVLLLAGSVGYSLMVQANTSKTWGTTTERAYRAFHAVDPGTNPTFFNEFRENLPADAPDCLRSYPDRPLDWESMGKQGIDECGPVGLAWIEDNYFPMLAGIYASNPGLALRYFVRTGGESAVKQGMASDITSVGLPIIEGIVFQGASSDPWNIPLFYLVLFFVAALALGARLLVRPRSRLNGLRARWGPVAAFLLGVGIWVALYLSFVDHPAAANRKAWPFFALAIMFSWWAVLAAWPSRRAKDQSGD